jgi:DNA processing protein
MYMEGDAAVFQHQSLSVIGSRKMSAYGAAVLRLLLPPLVHMGLIIVSGLAYGVDAEAHRITLEHQGRGIAVLGSGFDRIYPRAHVGLARQLVERGGVLLSEHPPGTLAFKGHFPARNRLIAALAPVLLIIEAAEYSGTFSTARAALDLGREVCVVPADITREQSSGVLRLLKDGARPVTCAEDILALYQLTLPIEARTPLRPALTGSLATLYACISQGATVVDTMTRATGLTIATINALLSVLELDGYITYRQSQWQIISSL